MSQGKGGGPTPIQINWEQFDKMCSYQCTQEEIAAFFDCSVDTLDRACQRDRNRSLAEFWDKRKFVGRYKLRKAQMDIVENGGPGAATMAIYLGKVMLGQSDQPQPPPPATPGHPGHKKPVMLTYSEFCVNAGYPPPYDIQIEKFYNWTFGDMLEIAPRLLLGARGYGKTEYTTILGSAYRVYQDYFNHIHNGAELTFSVLIITKSKTRNTSIIGEIAAGLTKNGVELETENSLLLRVKGLIGPNHSVEVLTIKSSFRGRHPKLIIMDDPVTEEDTSEAMRTLVKKKYDEAYKLTKNIVIIGQPAHAFDLYAHLRPRLQKMEVPWGSIPQLDADLVAMKIAGIDPNSIEMSYHLRIPVTGSMIFSNIKYCEKLPNGDAVAFLDPSDGGDYTALTIGKGFFDGIAFEGYAWQRPWYHCLDEIVPILVKLGVRRLCFETNSTGTQPIEQLESLLAPYGIGVQGKHSDTNKHACIEAAGSYSHMLHMSQESMPIYIQLIIQYEKGAKFDDPPDSLARLLEWIGLIRGKS